MHASRVKRMICELVKFVYRFRVAMRGRSFLWRNFLELFYLVFYYFLSLTAALEHENKSESMEVD